MGKQVRPKDEEQEGFNDDARNTAQHWHSLGDSPTNYCRHILQGSLA